MADEYNDEQDGRLVIADDEKLDSLNGEATRTLETDALVNEIMDYKPEASNMIQNSEKILKQSDIFVDVHSSTGQLVIPDSTADNINMKYIEEIEDGELTDYDDNPKFNSVDANSKCNREQQFDTCMEKARVIARGGIPVSNNGLYEMHFLNHSNSSKNKKILVDKSTSVFTRSTGMAGLDEHLLNMRPGTTFSIDITIICKTNGGNTMYISAKWKGRDYHGVLTDGEPMYHTQYSQKRNAAAHYPADKSISGGSGSNIKNDVNDSNSNNTSQIFNEGKGNTSSGKQRGNKRGGCIAKGNTNDKRSRGAIANPTTETITVVNPGAGIKEISNKLHEFDANELNSESSSNVLIDLSSSTANSNTLNRRRFSHSQAQNCFFEADQCTFPHRCPHRQCGFRFETLPDLNTHLLFGTHNKLEKKEVTYETSASQTLLPVKTVSVGCDPCFEQQQRPIYCAKCHQQLEIIAETDVASSEISTVTTQRPDTLISISKTNVIIQSCDINQKPQEVGAAVNDVSPGFSDISDDTAPTLEKQDIFDRHQSDATDTSASMLSTNKDNQQQPTSLLSNGSIYDRVSPEFTDSSLYTQIQQSDANENDKPHGVVGAATPPSSVIQTFTPNTTKRAQLPEVKVFNIDCDTNQKLDADSISKISVEKQSGQLYSLSPLTGTIVSSSLSIDPAEASRLQSNLATFVQYSPQIQTLVPAEQQSLGVVCINRVMGQPAALVPTGLLSFGTPLVPTPTTIATGSVQPRTVNSNSTSASGGEKLAAAVPHVYHKIYELQQHGNASAASTATKETSSNIPTSTTPTTRSSSTNPTALTNSSISPTANLRPNSALPASTNTVQQQLQRGFGYAFPPPPIMAQQQQQSLLAVLQQQQQQLQLLSQTNSQSPLQIGNVYGASDINLYPSSSGMAQRISPNLMSTVATANNDFNIYQQLQQYATATALMNSTSLPFQSSPTISDNTNSSSTAIAQQSQSQHQQQQQK